MTASTSMSVFHQWLLAAPVNPASGCAIMLHCADSCPSGPLIRDIAAYLNEYDDDGDGRWLPATPDLVEKIASDAHQRRLLGLKEWAAHEAGAPQTAYRKTLASLGQRGHVVFRAPVGGNAPPRLANTFHAGVGRARELPTTCHLILNPELLEQKCIAHIVGDVFLEWLHRQMRRSTPIHEIR